VGQFRESNLEPQRTLRITKDFQCELPTLATKTAARMVHAEAHLKLGGGDAADQVVLFLFTFGANGKGVEHSERKRKLDGLVLTIAQRALT
jgi:hypothetical protein